ncbi:5'-nucleotidase C-terminal domain-containing protein, partial [Rhizobium johnstonii]|uniref:5'-nucleotidase C-terminal domain-containing protein n=1 Tax=Rhizobium johnstonii TaxID=3019933 RepID=UPI003F9B5EA3
AADRLRLVEGELQAGDLREAPGDVQVKEGDSFTTIDPAKTYKVATNNFMRAGGDGYSIFKDGKNAYDYGPDIADVTAEYVAA